MIGIAERGYSDRSPFQVPDRLYLARGPRSRDNGEQGKAPGDGETADVRAGISVSLDSNVERGGSVVDRTADQRLHRGVAAAGIDELHVQSMVLEVAGRACNFVRHPAQKLAAIGELDLFALRFGAGGLRRRDD